MPGGCIFLCLPIKLSCNTDSSVTSNFCCGETEPRKLQTPPTLWIWKVKPKKVTVVGLLLGSIFQNVWAHAWCQQVDKTFPTHYNLREDWHAVEGGIFNTTVFRLFCAHLFMIFRDTALRQLSFYGGLKVSPHPQPPAIWIPALMKRINHISFNSADFLCFKCSSFCKNIVVRGSKKPNLWKARRVTSMLALSTRNLWSSEP